MVIATDTHRAWSIVQEREWKDRHGAGEQIRYEHPDRVRGRAPLSSLGPT